MDKVLAPAKDVCHRCSGRVPWFSFWGNLLLAVYKLLVGMFGASAALVADAMHSFADVIGSTGIVVATKISSKDPDARYPYGRGKAEFIGAVFVYTVLLLFATGIIISSVRTMVMETEHPPHFVTLLGAVVSVVYNVLMYRYATCVGMRNNSPAILADAFENRADAVSSVACILGIAGAMVLHPICDPIAALVVGFVILWNCQEQLREAAHGLMDGGLELEEQDLIRQLAVRQAHVVGVDFLRTRQTGARYWIDIGVKVPKSLGVQESDAIANRLRAILSERPNYHHIEVFVVPTGQETEEAPEGDASPLRETARNEPVKG